MNRTDFRQVYIPRKRCVFRDSKVFAWIYSLL